MKRIDDGRESEGGSKACRARLGVPSVSGDVDCVDNERRAVGVGRGRRDLDGGRKTTDGGWMRLNEIWQKNQCNGGESSKLNARRKKMGVV